MQDTERVGVIYYTQEAQTDEYFDIQSLVIDQWYDEGAVPLARAENRVVFEKLECGASCELPVRIFFPATRMSDILMEVGESLLPGTRFLMPLRVFEYEHILKPGDYLEFIDFDTNKTFMRSHLLEMKHMSLNELCELYRIHGVRGIGNLDTVKLESKQVYGREFSSHRKLLVLTVEVYDVDIPSGYELKFEEVQV